MAAVSYNWQLPVRHIERYVTSDVRDVVEKYNNR
jgi:hypothetical protein